MKRLATIAIATLLVTAPQHRQMKIPTIDTVESAKDFCN